VRSEVPFAFTGKIGKLTIAVEPTQTTFATCAVTSTARQTEFLQDVRS
jgi:hypothetical protein